MNRALLSKAKIDVHDCSGSVVPVHGRLPISEPDEDGQFEVVYRIGDITLGPCVRDRNEELAARPDDLVFNGVWAFAHTGGLSGLVVSEVELIPHECKVHEAK